MKYVWKSIASYIRCERLVFILYILCIFCSSLVVNFVFGFYHHLEQKKIDALNDVSYFKIDFVDETRTHVTKGSMMDTLMKLDQSVLDGCSIELEGRFAEDQTLNPATDNTTLMVGLDFMIKNGVITVGENEEELKKNNILVDGHYFTAEQIENGEYVCVAPVKINFSEEEDQMWADKYSANSDGTYTVDGKQYTCIGHVDSGSVVPWVPVTTVDDDCYIQRIWFSYENVLTRKQYETISEVIKMKYGDMANIPDLDIKETDHQKFYSVLIALTVCIALLAGIVLAMLYEYVMLKRRKTLTVYRLCGMSMGMAASIYLKECLILTGTLYILSVLVYAYGVLPYLSQSFEYLGDAYSLKTYVILGIIYILVVLLFLSIIICKQISDNVVSELKGV